MKLLSVALVATLFSVAAGNQLAAQDAPTPKHVVYHVGNGLFATPPVSGNDLLQLAGQKFQISVIVAKDTKPLKHGHKWAIYNNIKMQGVVYSGFSPNQPFPIHSKHAVLVLSERAPGFDLFKLTTDVTVSGIKLTVTADVHMPKGTLAGFEIKPFNNDVTLTNSPQNVTLTYASATAATVLDVSQGTFTGTAGKPPAE
jgi:hypothetical protein